MPSATLVNDGRYMVAGASSTFNDTGYELNVGAAYGAALNSLLRFTVNAAQGETIASATLRLWVFGVNFPEGFSYSVDIQAENSDDAAWVTGVDDVAKVNDIQARPGTSEVAALYVGAGTAGEFVECDVTALLQVVVNRAGWVSGNHLLLILYTGVIAGPSEVIAIDFGSSDWIDPATFPTLTFAGSSGSTNATSLAWMMIDEQEATP